MEKAANSNNNVNTTNKKSIKPEKKNQGKRGGEKRDQHKAISLCCSELVYSDLRTEILETKREKRGRKEKEERDGEKEGSGSLWLGVYPF